MIESDGIAVAVLCIDIVTATHTLWSSDRSIAGNIRGAEYSCCSIFAFPDLTPTLLKWVWFIRMI